MKILVYYPTNGTEKTVDLDQKSEQRLYGKKIGDQFDGTLVLPEFADCIMQIQGGNDYHGIAMVPNRDTNKRIRLLLSKGEVGYRCKKSHVRKRKTVRGSIIGNDIQVISVMLVRIPEDKTIEGLTDVINNKTHLPKKAYKLRELFGIPEGEDIIKYVTKLVKENDPEAKVPRLKITGLLSEAEKAKRAQKLAMRQAKKDKFMKEKAEYETKYGVKL